MSIECHRWHAGVLDETSWHGLERVEVIEDADTLIRLGEESGAWPCTIESAAMRTVDGLDAPRSQAIVGVYHDGTRRVLGVVSKGYRHLRDTEWRDLVRAAAKAGAKPSGAFSLFDGRRVLATFRVSDPASGFVEHLMLADSFDRTTSVLAGSTSIRVVCRNTMDAAMRIGSGGFGRLRHNSSLGEKVEALGEAIEQVTARGATIRELYTRARETRLSQEQAAVTLAALFPPAAPKDGETDAERTVRLERAEKAQQNAVRAMARAENNEGPTLATLWNGATFLVDRDETGHARKRNSVQSMLFGAQGKRVEEIQKVIEVALRDGTTELVSAAEARTMGLDPAQIARAAGGLDAFV